MTMNADAERDVEALGTALAAALSHHDGAAAAALFAADAVLLAPGRRIVTGLADIETFWSNAVQRLLEAGSSPVGTKLLGPAAARSIGRLAMKFDEGPARDVTSKYLLVAEKSGGGWKIESLSWSRIVSGRSVRAQGARQDKPDGNQGNYDKVATLYSG